VESQAECLECGDEIPQARREAVKGCLYCTSCQVEKEGK
jgi:RNA polymerase-binding transcription factor DksA